MLPKLVLALQRGQYSSPTIAESHVPGCCRRSQVIINLLQNQKGERQGKGPLHPGKEKKKSRMLKLLNLRSFPSLIQETFQRIRCLTADGSFSLNRESTLEHGHKKLLFLIFLQVGSPVFLYHGPFGASVYSF